MATAKTTPYTCRSVVRHDGKRYASGETLTLSAAQAEPLLALGAIAPTTATKATGTGA